MLLSKLKNAIAVLTTVGAILLSFSAVRLLAKPSENDRPIRGAREVQELSALDAKKPANYCWLVFGPKGKTRVLLRARGEELAVDRNGDASFAGRGERFASEIAWKDVTITDPGSKTTYVITQVHDMHVVPPEKFLDIRVHVKGRPYALWAEVMLAADPKSAPEVHFGGPFAMTTNGKRIVNRASYLLENSLVNLGFLIPDVIKDLAGKELVDDPSLPQSLKRGQPNALFAFLANNADNSSVAVGSTDDENGDTPPFAKNVHPVVDLVFPAQESTAPPIKKRIPMRFIRGCFFRADVVVPPEAGSGTAKATFSFTSWNDGKATPTTVEIPIEPRH